MDTEKIVTNSETVEEADDAAVEEELVDENSGSMGFVAGVGIGVLAGMMLVRYVVPRIGRKFRSFRTKYVTVKPTEGEAAEETPAGTDQDGESGEENQET